MAKQTPIIEVCVDSIESALAAERGRADRLELCSALSEGGLSPTRSLLIAVKKLVKIPVFCMVRPRRGPMVFSLMEKDVILGDAKDLKEAGADGLVFGALMEDGSVDLVLCSELIQVAGKIPCTFHRAFDLCTDPVVQLEKIISLRFTRLLTSGCEKTAEEGKSLIKELVLQSEGRLSIMVGAGVRSTNCLGLVSATGVKELHTSAKIERNLPSYGSGAKMGDAEDSVYFVVCPNEVSLMKDAFVI